MSIEDVVRAWKAEEDAVDSNIPDNPIGDELSDEELNDVLGGMRCMGSCSRVSCGNLTEG